MANLFAAEQKVRNRVLLVRPCSSRQHFLLSILSQFLSRL